MNFRLCFQNKFFNSAAPQGEAQEPLLSDRQQTTEEDTVQNDLPVISAPILSTITSTGVIPHVKETQSSRFISSIQSSSLRYSPVYKNPENHIEELNFRLKTLNNRAHGFSEEDEGDVGGAQPIPSDINPSVGSDNEKDSDLNIRQMESSVSSLSGLPSEINSPENRRHAGANWRVEQYETNF